ncbi:MAG: DUF4157 domain-containing protein [Methylovulum miyakonense]|uniref:eCIS core domain-containing protein n=1 Tax=Methylovulum miyakonense TaxID=645578 RepID=UPI003BB4A51E
MMKTSTEKSSNTSSKKAIQSANQPFFAKAGGGFFAPAVQMKMAVNKLGDTFEQEADLMADKVMRMPSPAPMPGKEEKLQRQPDEKLQKKEENNIQKAAMPEEKVQKKEDGKLQRAAMPDEKIQKKDDDKLQKAPANEDKLQRKGGDGTPAVHSNVQSAIQNKTTGGQPLSSDVRSFMEPRFNADFSKVRVHSDPESAGLSNQLSARAFTYQNHVFFSHDQFQPGSSEGKKLLAHELTHTVQQGHAIQRSPQISTTTTPKIQRSAKDEILDWIAGKANNIMGFRMFTIILGVNPITMQGVDTGAANMLRALIELIPGGALITKALDSHGIIDKVANWLSGQIKSLGMVGGQFKNALSDFIATLGVADLAPWNWGGVFNRAVSIFSAPIDRLISFGKGLATDIITFIKDAILKPIAAYAKANTNGYALLCAVMGKDPITNEKVPDDAEALMGAFLKFIGQEETWANMKKANAIARAFAWFKGAVAAVKGFINEIPGLFLAAFQALEIADLILIPNAFIKLAKVFGSFAGRFIDWGLNAVWNLLEIIFDSVKPGAMAYVKRTGAALKSILKNPMPFVGNLVKAGKLGFESFASNFGSHFKAGLIDWLTGSLVGVYIPKALSLPELGKLALSVLGITWAGIRKKLVKALGDKGEKIVGGIEKGVEWAIKGFEIVKKIAEGGMAAAWEMIQEKLTDLKDQVISGITGFVTDTIIKKAIPKLIGMFIPGAGFIPAIISIYDTITVFVEKLAKIAQVVMAFIDSIVAIAAGNITSAARRVESILGGLLSLAISFLAGFLGLGKVTDKIKEVIDKVRDKVDKAIDAALAWIVAKAKAAFAKLFGGKDKKDERTDKEKENDLAKALAEARVAIGKSGAKEKDVRKQLNIIKSRYRMVALNLIVDNKSKGKETVHVFGKINPEGETPPSDIKDEDGDDLAKAKRESNEARIAAETKVTTEISWNTQQQQKVTDNLKTAPVPDRRKLGELKQQLEGHKRTLEPIKAETNALLKSWQDAVEVAKAADMREMVIEEFHKIKAGAEQRASALAAIVRPAVDAASGSKTKPWPHGSITKLGRRNIANHQVEVHVDERGPHVHLDRGTGDEQYINLKGTSAASESTGNLPAGVATESTVLSAMQNAIDTWKQETGE